MIEKNVFIFFLLIIFWKISLFFFQLLVFSHLTIRKTYPSQNFVCSQNFFPFFLRNFRNVCKYHHIWSTFHDWQHHLFRHLGLFGPRSWFWKFNDNMINWFNFFKLLLNFELIYIFLSSYYSFIFPAPYSPRIYKNMVIFILFVSLDVQSERQIEVGDI